MTDDERVELVLLPEAQQLVTDMRDEDPRALQRRLTAMHPGDLRDLTMLLAAMVPDDRPVSELLAWYLNPKENTCTTSSSTP